MNRSARRQRKQVSRKGGVIYGKIYKLITTNPIICVLKEKGAQKYAKQTCAIRVFCISAHQFNRLPNNNEKIH